MTLYYESELYHYGIPGMKWGHRKARQITNAYAKTGVGKAHMNATKKIVGATLGAQRKVKGNPNSATRKKAKKINKSRSIGGKFGTFLVSGYGGNRTYNTARAAGYGKINSGIAASVVSVTGAALGGALGATVASRLTSNPQTASLVSSGASVAGSILANRLVSNRIEDRNDAALRSGTNLRQRGY